MSNSNHGLAKLNFSLTQLEYVLAVHKFGHFAKAAEACRVTQPTLSMQIQKLEEDLGVVLFDRSKKPVLLTDAGQRTIEQMQLILFEVRKLENLVHQSGEESLKGELSLGIIPTIAPYVLPKLLPMIDKEFPDISLNIIEKQTHEIIETLANDEIDVGLLATPLKVPKIFELPLYYEPFSLLCRKDHPLAQNKRIKYSSLSLNDIWLLEEGHCLRHQVLDVCAMKAQSRPQIQSEGKARPARNPSSQVRKFNFESGSLETLKNLVNSFGGYTLLPAMAAESLGTKTILIPFERPIPAREIGLVYRREHYKSSLIEALGEAILKSIPEELRKIRQKDLEVLPVE